MPGNEPAILWDALRGSPPRSARYIWAAKSHIVLNELIAGSTLDCALEQLRGRSVLLVTRSQLCAALVLIQLDGIARRIVLCPPDLHSTQIPFVISTAEVDAVISDQESSELGAAVSDHMFVRCSPQVVRASADRLQRQATEWILFTSGTSGPPKMVSHTLATLGAAIDGSGHLAGAMVWSTFYDIRRYGGLQIFLRAVLGGGSLLLADGHESTADFLSRAAAHSVTHLTGTPSHWRRALMSGCAQLIAPQYVRLSGEIADQGILDSLRAIYPTALIAHAFASTEAGVGFEVEDGLAGIPVSYFESPGTSVLLKVADSSLRIRSGRTALRYIGNDGSALLDDDGYIDTGDILELRNDRYYFVGRHGGIINVGGLKVHPEEVEAVINRHPRVQMSRVQSRKNALTGAVVVAEIVLKSAEAGSHAAPEISAVKSEILQQCQRALAAHKVPAVIRIVASLDVTASGKVARSNA